MATPIIRRMLPVSPGLPVPPGPAAAVRLERTARDAGATRAFGAALGRCLSPGALVTLSGGLGAGKTTFAQGIAGGLGITGRVSSPTYTILHGYALGANRIGPGHPPAGGTPLRADSGSIDPAAGQLLHADLYRIRSAAEALELGLDECRADGDIVVVEWPEQADGALGEADVTVTLADVVGQSGRSDTSGEAVGDAIGDADRAADRDVDRNAVGDAQDGSDPGGLEPATERRIVLIALTGAGRSILACFAADDPHGAGS